MADPYVGQVSPFAFPFAPINWAYCNGGTAPMNQYTALFALIGTTFGGDGRSTIGLPNLNGAAPCGSGQGPGLTNRNLGQSFGTATVTIDLTTMAAHTHGANAGTVSRFGGQVTNTPTIDSSLASPGNIGMYATGSPDNTMAPGAISMLAAGGGAHNNLQPYLTVNYCIALVGLYPEFN